MEARTSRKVKWEQMRRGEIEAAAREMGVVLLPIGATEQHGPHLPLDTDTSAVLDVALRAAKQIEDFPVLVLPPISWGLSPHHMIFPGTLTLSWQTFGALVTEICACIHAHGFRKIMLLNGHGGNSGILNALAVDMNGKGIGIVVATYFELLAKDTLVSLCEADDRMSHSGELETSIQLCLHPELVDRDQIDASLSVPPKEYLARRRFHGVYRPLNLSAEAPLGVTGIATTATAAKGEKLLASVAEALVTFLRHYHSQPV